ncbi:hypothetical protein DAPPUDRAFT_252370 [Daphnia pulex]|uniref:Major facilitator superfamily (MFS) profile domain-containing protein n=1 Tax=Daphnia pulex TaxID=6669 RepID=E9H2J6_DAPPU|nr:hypothetical protein DAPPUDRAFT_252370 [Daphnia pulex]|eukprot:EFX74053.1 hypothetical protein DAPPUDRAFT_252370 [Daphnia pulex]
MTGSEKDTLPSRWDQVKGHLRVNRALLPLKAVMFLFYGAFSAVLLPYITLHMLQIGITIEEVGIIYAVLPFASCLGPPIAGMIADKIGNYKVVLMGSIFATAGFHTLLLTIDAHGINPTQVVTNSNESSTNYLSVKLMCDDIGRTFLELPNNCANNTCPYDNLWLRGQPTIRLMTSECIPSCEEKANSTDTCFLTNETSDCYHSLDEDVFLELQLENNSMSADSSFCLFPVNQLFLSNSSEVSLSCDCPLQCSALMMQPLLPACSAKDDDSSLSTADNYDYAKHNKGFWLYLFLRIMAMATLGTSFTMLDATTICLIKKYKGQLGRQRLFGVLGSAAFAMTTGILLDWAATLNNAFLFIFLIELNASSYLLGFTVTLGALVGVPFLYVSDIIVKKVGKLVILITAFFIYSVRFIGYSFITDPWMSLPFEALEAVTIHLMGVSCSMYCAQYAPPGLLATLQGMAGSCHYAIGRGTGSFIGGILIASYGTRETFRMFGIAAGICGVLYVIFYYTYLRKNELSRTRKVPGPIAEWEKKVGSMDLVHLSGGLLTLKKKTQK